MQTEKPAESTPLFGSTATFGAANVMKSPSTNIFGGNTNGNSENKSKETPTTGFSFKLPSSTTLTAVTGTESPAYTQTPNSTSTPVSEVTKTTESKLTEPIFGNAGGFSFADLAKKADTSEPFAASKTVSFSDLAQNSTNGTPAFSKTPSTAGGFFGLSNRDTFNNLMTPRNGDQTSATKGDDSENHTEDANYDPHYDPIIALPDEIQVSTGEENEEKLFGERAKLYRFDSDSKEVSLAFIRLNKNDFRMKSA